MSYIIHVNSSLITITVFHAEKKGLRKLNTEKHRRGGKKRKNPVFQQMIKLRHRHKKRKKRKDVYSIKTMISTYRKTNINKYILNRYKNEQSTVSKPCNLHY